MTGLAMASLIRERSQPTEAWADVQVRKYAPMTLTDRAVSAAFAALALAVAVLVLR
jgi:hypothetical protein